MTEGNPILAMLLHSSGFLGPALDHEENLKPLPRQFDLGIGDKCLVATANTPLEEDFTVLEILDPEEHAKTFPNWEERWGLNRHVLAKYFSLEDQEGDIGWFARVKLVPITDEQYEEASTWRLGEFPDEVPEWITEAFTAYTDELSKLDPAVIPVLVTCPNAQCGSREVHLHVLAQKKFDVRAGEVQREGKTLYVPTNDPAVEEKWVAHLKCVTCGATAELEESDWELPHPHHH